MKTILFFITGILSISKSHAFTGTSALDLENFCTTYTSIAEHGDTSKSTDLELANAMECMGFINGFREGALLTGIRMASAKKINQEEMMMLANKFQGWCEPDSVTTYQVSRIYLKFMKENPKLLNESAGIALSIALASTWSCTEQ